MLKLPYRRIIGALAAVLMVFSLISLEVLETYAVTPTYEVSSDYKKSKYYDNLTALTLTGNQRSDVVRVALTQLGYHEGNSEKDFAGDNTKGNRNFVEYNRYHGRYDNNEGNGLSYGYYWCAAFSTWCAVQAGIPESIVPAKTGAIGISTQRLRSWFLNNANYYVRGTYTPITGDYIFFKDAGAAVQTTHVGLVLYVKGDTVYTIEGNAGGLDCVAVREYALSSTYIVGYGVPNYKTGTAIAIDLTNKTNPGEYVITASSLAIRPGPGTSYTPALGALPQAAVVQVTEVSGNWGLITYNGITGWTSLSYALPLSIPNITITYDANGGTGAPSTQIKTAGKPILLSSKIPTRMGHRFLGWSTSATATKALYAAGGNYTADNSIHLYAVWESETYVIRFADYDGTTLQSKTYHYGDTVTPPATPTRKSDQTYRYTFRGWDKTVTVAKSAVTYTAVYDTQYIDYSIVFCNDDGTVLSTASYHYNDTITAPAVPKKESDKTYSYTFIGWGEPVGRVTGDKVYTAVYEKNYLGYLITFSDENGMTLSQEIYHYGDTVKQPPAPTKKSDEYYDYIFLGWDKTVTEVQGVAFYTATYEKRAREYTVTFQNEDGTILAQTPYHYADTVTLPADPTMETDKQYIYAFLGWSADGETVTSVLPVTTDAVYTALYEKTPLTYTVTFRDESGRVYATDNYYYGDTVQIPKNPQKAADAMYTYRFIGWGEEVAETVTDHATYVAQFEAVPNTSEKKPDINHLLSPGADEESVPVLGIAIFALTTIGIAALLIHLLSRKRR